MYFEGSVEALIPKCARAKRGRAGASSPGRLPSTAIARRTPAKSLKIDAIGVTRAKVLVTFAFDIHSPEPNQTHLERQLTSRGVAIFHFFARGET